MHPPQRFAGNRAPLVTLRENCHTVVRGGSELGNSQRAPLLHGWRTVDIRCVELHLVRSSVHLFLDGIGRGTRGVKRLHPQGLGRSTPMYELGFRISFFVLLCFISTSKIARVRLTPS